MKARERRSPHDTENDKVVLPAFSGVLLRIEGGMPAYVSCVMQAAPMHEPPTQCSRTRSAVPQDVLCAEGAVLSPVPMQLPAGAPLNPTKRHVSMIIISNCSLTPSIYVSIPGHALQCLHRAVPRVFKTLEACLMQGILPS